VHETGGTDHVHELAIAESVVAAVLERTEGRRVSVVRLRVGRLTAVVPDALTFCFDLATAGTPLEGAALEIAEEPGRGHCRSCDAHFELPDAFLLCACGSADVELLAGRELMVASVEVG
jgi:hydrogenase nickel incorporation protein HypA/HybF